MLKFLAHLSTLCFLACHELQTGIHSRSLQLFFRTCCVGLNSCVELVRRGRTSRARRQQCGSPSLWPATRAAGCKACYASRSPRPQLRALGQDSMNSKSILESPRWGANEANLSFELALMGPFRGTLAARSRHAGRQFSRHAAARISGLAARRGTHFRARGTPRHAAARSRHAAAR